MDRLPQPPRAVLVALAAVLSVVLLASVTGGLFSLEEGAGVTTEPEPTPDADAATSSAVRSDRLQTVVLALVLIGTLGALFALLEDPRWVVGYAAGITAIVLLLGGTAWVVWRVLSWIVDEGSSTEPEPIPTPTPAATPGPASGVDDPAPVPVSGVLSPAALLIGLLVVGLVSVVVLTRTGHLGSGGAESADSSAATPGGIRETAETAARRVETAASPEAAGSVVYEAWLDMLDVLEVEDPHAATPRQFADRAIEAGCDPAAIERLTRAFEAVRYGDRVLEEQERDAVVAALRRVRETGGSGAGGGAAGSTNREREPAGTEAAERDP